MGANSKWALFKWAQKGDNMVIQEIGRVISADKVGAVIERLKWALNNFPDIDPYSWWKVQNTAFYWHYNRNSNVMELWVSIHGRKLIEIDVNEIVKELEND